jgi:FixJ family two-component response regulator
MITDPILIVVDEPDLRVPLREALERDGYTVEDADSADAALALIEQKHYPVILTDLHMPGGASGLDLIAAVKGRDPEAVCVVITGYASLDVAVEAIKRGAYDFVQKPFKLLEIEAVLDRALEHARLLAKLDAYRRDLEERVASRVSGLRTFRDEVLLLNGLLLEAQDQTDEQAAVAPFVQQLLARFSPDGHAVLLPDGQGWRVLMEQGSRPWPSGAVPGPGELLAPVEWGWPGGYPEGYLFPLRRNGLPLGALFLGFAHRSSFDPEDPFFTLLRIHLLAVLNGLHRYRALAAGKG